MQSFDAVLTVLAVHIQGIMACSQICISSIRKRGTKTVLGSTDIPISQDPLGSPSTYHGIGRLVP